MREARLIDFVGEDLAGAAFPGNEGHQTGGGHFRDGDAEGFDAAGVDPEAARGEQLRLVARAEESRGADPSAPFVGEAADPAGIVAVSKLAEQGKFDLVVMGSHGHGSLVKLVMGSVATEVLAHCTVPVLLVR